MKIWSAEIKELESLYTSIKGKFPELEKELERLIKADDENMVLLYSRRCLEVIITDLCECELKRPRKTEPLKGIIDKLHKEEKVPSHIIASMHSLNSLSTFGAHPKDFEPEQVKPVLNNLATIFRWYQKYKDSQIIFKTKVDEEKTQARDVSLEGVRKKVHNGVQEKHAKLTVKKLLSILLITAIIVIAGIIIYLKIFRQNTLERLRSSGERISVAVMPFQNMTNDTSWNIWQDGIKDELIGQLSNNPEELQVRQPESINSLIKSKGLTNYASITPTVASVLSKKLEANVFVSGNIKQAGSTIRLNAQVSDSKTEEVMKSFRIDGSKKDDILHMVDSLSVRIQDYLVVSKLREKLPYSADEFQTLLTSDSPEAFMYVVQGRKAFYDVDYPAAIKFFTQGLGIDSNLVVALSFLSMAYKNMGIEDLSEKWLLRAYAKRDRMTMYQKAYIDWHYAVQFGTPQEQIMYCKQLLEFDDQDAGIYYILGYGYQELKLYDKVVEALEKHLEIYKKWDSRPVWVFSYTVLGRAYHYLGMYKKEAKLYKKAELDFPDDQFILQRQIPLALTLKDTAAERQYIQKYRSVRRSKSHPEANIITGIGLGYYDAGIFDKAEEYYRKALSMEPNSPVRMNRLAFFLIDKERNIDEGMALISKALELSPANFEYTDCKGWGLYKQGKYKEALELLENNWKSMQPRYNHTYYLHLEATKKAVAEQKNN